MARSGMVALVVAAVAVVALVSFLSGLSSGPLGEQHLESRSATSAERGHEERLLEGLESLGERIARLEARERRRPHVAGPDSGTAMPSGAEFPADDVESMHAAEEAQFARERAFLDANLRAERVDRRWAAEAEVTIRGAFEDGDALRGSAIERIDCRTTLCRLDVTHDSLQDAEVLMANLPGRTTSLRSARIQRIADDRSIIFFGREQDGIRRGTREPGERE